MGSLNDKGNPVGPTWGWLVRPLSIIYSKLDCRMTSYDQDTGHVTEVLKP
jgi:hypothetical protein